MADIARADRILSILYLRCLVAASIDTLSLVKTTFNSLFEMPVMCYPDHESRKAYSFNSLFEMPST